MAVHINKTMTEIPTTTRLGASASPPGPPTPSSSSPTSPCRSRGYLPHFDQRHLTQFLTFRLHDAVPDAVIQSWKAKLSWVANLPATDPREAELRHLIARYEDVGHGACW